MIRFLQLYLGYKYEKTLVVNSIEREYMTIIKKHYIVSHALVLLNSIDRPVDFFNGPWRHSVVPVLVHPLVRNGGTYMINRSLT